MTNTATAAQLATIAARRIDDTARAMMASGVTLTHEQADELGEEALSWISNRLNLNVEALGHGVVCTPPVHYSGEAARAAGVEIMDEQ